MNYSQEELVKMLVAIYKKLNNVELKLKGGSRLAPDNTYLTELLNEASKIKL